MRWGYWYACSAGFVLDRIRRMTTPTPDPLTALAAELGRIGRRLDGIGVELMTLRDGMGAAGAAASSSWSPSGLAGSWVASPAGPAALPFSAPPAGLGPVPGWPP